MADPVALAQDWWDRSRGNPGMVATLLAEGDALALAMATGSKSGDVIQGTKNQSSYTKRLSLTLDERRTALTLFHRAVKCDRRPSRNRRARFGCW